MSSPLTQRQLERELIDLLEARTGLRPRVAMLLGSGHASITNQLKDKVAIGGDDVPGFGVAGGGPANPNPNPNPNANPDPNADPNPNPDPNADRVIL